MTLHITFLSLRQAGACEERYTVFRKAMLRQGYGKDTPIPLWEALASNGLDDTLWALQAVLPEEDDEKRRVVSLFLADVLERVEPLMKDERSRDVIPALRRHAVTPLTQEEWRRLAAAASVAAWAEEVWEAASAWEAASVAAVASVAAASAGEAGEAASVAAWAEEVWEAASAGEAASVAASAEEARAEAREVEKGWQTERLRWYLKSQDKEPIVP